MDPSRTTLPYIERHKSRGQDYDETFSPELNPYRAMLWRLEQQALTGILQSHPASSRITLLDFACGTGRVLGHVRKLVASATGVDVSTTMLEVARKVAPDAELIEADLTRRDVLGERRFNLITAFRFFPNAEPELRRAIFAILALHLEPGGLFVFNNHKNRNSLTRRISRLLRREVLRGTMSHAEVEELVSLSGLNILRRIPLGILPGSDRHMFLPASMLARIEERLRGVPALSDLAQDIIYVCGRPNPEAA
jgi:SAM-dependent methyltransferase